MPTETKTPRVIIKDHVLELGRLSSQLEQGPLRLSFARACFVAMSRPDAAIRGRSLNKEDFEKYVEGLRKAGVEVVVDITPITPAASTAPITLAPTTPAAPITPETPITPAAPTASITPAPTTPAGFHCSHHPRRYSLSRFQLSAELTSLTKLPK